MCLGRGWSPLAFCSGSGLMHGCCPCPFPCRRYSPGRNPIRCPWPVSWRLPADVSESAPSRSSGACFGTMPVVPVEPSLSLACVGPFGGFCYGRAHSQQAPERRSKYAVLDVSLRKLHGSGIAAGCRRDVVFEATWGQRVVPRMHMEVWRLRPTIHLWQLAAAGGARVEPRLDQGGRGFAAHGSYQRSPPQYSVISVSLPLSVPISLCFALSFSLSHLWDWAERGQLVVVTGCLEPLPRHNPWSASGSEEIVCTGACRRCTDISSRCFYTLPCAKMRADAHLVSLAQSITRQVAPDLELFFVVAPLFRLQLPRSSSPKCRPSL